MHFWLHHTAQCAEKIVSAHWHMGSASTERVGQGGGWGHPQGAVHMAAAKSASLCKQEATSLGPRQFRHKLN